MQNAGRILLMPKGDYSAGTTYTMLDLVNHGGASWVCKKDCTGQEPTDSNTTYWQRFGTAVDLSNYLQKSGGTIGGNITQNHDGDYIKYSFQNGNRYVSLMLSKAGSIGLYDESTGKWLFLWGKDSDGTFNGTASGNLPLIGGNIKSTSNIPVKVESTSSLGSCFLGYVDINNVYGYIGCKKGIPKYSTGSAEYTIHHDGNKPFGTYTGNGDATTRTIATGGIGNACVISSAKGTVLVGRSGATINGVFSSAIVFKDGSLIMASTENAVNASGYEYTYTVI